MRRGKWKSLFSPKSRGVQWSSAVENTLWGMASGVAVVLGIVLGLAEIAPASCQPPAGSVVITVGCTVLQMWRGGVPRALQARVLRIHVCER